MNMPPSSGRGGPSVTANFLQALLELTEMDRQSVLSEALSIWCPECGKSHAICSCEADAYNALGVADAQPISPASPGSPIAPAVPTSPTAPGGMPPGFQPNPFAAAGEMADEDDMSIDMDAFRRATSGV